MKKVLVLEDEANIRSFVVINLKRAGYEAIEAETGEEALAQLKRNPDIKVALLDIMLPDMDGFEVCRRIRAGDNNIGIIMLTARTQEMDKVTGLMTGADDYVTKPFSPAELTARIDALSLPPYRRRGPGGYRRDQPAAFPAEHPQPYPGEKRTAGQAYTGGVLHHKAVYGQPGKSPLPGGNSRLGVGTGLLRRAEDRGRKHPTPAH